MSATPPSVQDTSAEDSGPRVSGPKGLPLLGSVLDFSREPRRFIEESVHSHGDVVYFHTAGMPFYVFSHPDAIQDILVGKHKDEIKDVITRGLSRGLGQGLLTSEGAVWKRQRKLAAPSFARADIAHYGRDMTDITEEFLERVRAGSVHDVHRDMAQITLDVVVRTLFNASAGQRGERVAKAVTSLTTNYRSGYIGWQRTLPDWVPTRSRRRFHTAVATLDEVLSGIVNDARQRVENASEDVEQDRSLLARLLAAREEGAGGDSEGMSDEQLRDEIITLFLAGHETTAIALTSALYLMGTHPELQERAYQEVHELLRGRPDGRLQAEDMASLSFVDAVVRETMRLYPPAWIIGRETLRDIQIAGVDVPKGAQILISQWVVHRDPRWFKDPLAFHPDRWLDGSTAQLPRTAYLPFGGGPRVCIGNHFATLEAVLILATLLHTLRVEALPSTLFELFPAITLRPTRPVHLRLHRRED